MVLEGNYVNHTVVVADLTVNYIASHGSKYIIESFLAPIWLLKRVYKMQPKTSTMGQDIILRV